MKSSFMYLMPTCAAIAVIALVVSCSGKPTTLSAPIEACKAQYTGRERTEDTTTLVCAGYDSKGVCTVWMPIYSSMTYREARVQCDWTEWQ